jgi:hypothetical protein
VLTSESYLLHYTKQDLLNQDMQVSAASDSNLNVSFDTYIQQHEEHPHVRHVYTEPYDKCVYKRDAHICRKKISSTRHESLKLMGLRDLNTQVLMRYS